MPKCDCALKTRPQNDKGLVPADVVPDPMDMSLDKAEAAMVAKELKQLLLDAVPLSCNLPRATLPNYDNIPGNLMLSSLGLKLGDRVVLDDMKVRGWDTKCDIFPVSCLRMWVRLVQGDNIQTYCIATTYLLICPSILCFVLQN